MTIAIFDLDHTLLAGDSDHTWGQFLVDKKIVEPEHHQKQNDYFYEQYKAGTLDILEYLEFALHPLTLHPADTLNAWREEFVEERIKPLVTQKSLDLIRKHREAGDTLLIITATNGFVTAPIAELLNIPNLIAPDPEIKDDCYTGRITGIPSFQEGKVTRLKQWLEETGESLEGASFYSDSHNDLPLLRMVDKPVAVDPDPILSETAREQGWPIISLRDDT